MIDPSIKEREKADENFRRLIRFASLLRLVGGGSSDNAFLSIDFATGNNIGLVNGSGGAVGVAQKLDNTYQSFLGSVLRKTTRGAIVEPARQNFVAASADFNNAAWTVSNTFTGKVAKTSALPSQTAYEFESDATAGLLNQSNRGTFTAGVETLSAIVEAMPSAVSTEFYVADQTNASSPVVRCPFNFTTKTFQHLGGGGTSQLFGYIDFGLGPNGGELYLLFCQAIPPTAGNTRRFFCWPCGNVTSAPNRKVVYHHMQLDVGAWVTSPIVNASTTSNTRAAEVVTISIPTGTYDVRFTMQDGTIDDRYTVASAANLLTIPTDVTENAAIQPTDAFLQVLERNGYLTKISIWNQKANNVHALGDSYLVNGGAGAQIIPKFLPPLLYRPRVWTFDGVGATSLTQQAVRFDGTPQYYGDLLVIVDGIIDGLVNSGSFAAIVQPAIESMIGHLTTSPKQWLYIQPLPDVSVGAIGSAGYTTWKSVQDQIQAAYPNNYIPTLTLMQTHGDGSANDISDIANGWCPRSLRISSSDVHTNPLGSRYFAQIIDDAILSKRF